MAWAFSRNPPALATVTRNAVADQRNLANTVLNAFVRLLHAVSRGSHERIHSRGRRSRCRRPRFVGRREALSGRCAQTRYTLEDILCRKVEKCFAHLRPVRQRAARRGQTAPNTGLSPVSCRRALESTSSSGPFRSTPTTECTEDSWPGTNIAATYSSRAMHDFGRSRPHKRVAQGAEPRP